MRRVQQIATVRCYNKAHVIPFEFKYTSSDRQNTYSVILRRTRAAIVAVGINKPYTFWVCVCGLKYPACNTHAPYYMVILACPALLYFSTFSHKRHDFRKKKWLLKIKRVFWFSPQLLCETFLNLRIIHRLMIKKIYIGLYVKYSLFFSDCNETWIF